MPDSNPPLIGHGCQVCEESFEDGEIVVEVLTRTYEESDDGKAFALDSPEAEVYAHRSCQEVL